MNLIEKLGGYANAKFLISAMTEGASMEFNGVLSNRQQLFEVLLEYRRQHNTFEVEDNVVCWVTDRVGLIDCFIGDYFCMVKIKNDVGGFTFIKNNMEAIKHATDAEIKVGRRLPVIESDDCSDIRNHISPNTVVIDHAT